VCVPYVAGGDGKLRPVPGVDRCPQAAFSDGPCRLARHAERARKSGPAFPLTLLWCRTHGAHFTIYPLGFTPYGRQRVAPAEHLRASDTSARDRWAGTVFEVAAGAAAGELGVRDAGFEDGLPQPRHSTVRRRVAAAGLLLGLSPAIDDRQAEQVAQVLDIPGLDHAQARQGFARASGLRGRGAVIVSVLGRMPLSGAVERRLLCAGAHVQLWGPPGIWDVAGRRLVFPLCGTTAGKSPGIKPITPNEFVPPSAHGPPRRVPSC
jgi:hypothetical protein